MNDKYKKGGDAGSKGVRFQVSLLTLFLLKALRNLKNWRLSTENNEAGKFDDVVLEYPDGAILLQAKHRDNKNKITLEDLLSTNTKRDDFSLPKYFISYQEIKRRFKVKNVIVCTNANFDKKTLTFLNSRSVPPDSMLYYEADNCLLYTFNDGILSALKNNTEIYLQQCTKKKIDESVINEENLIDFLEHLQFYFNYPSGKDLENVSEKQLLSVMRDIGNFYNEISSSDIHSKMMDWFQQKDGEYFTEIHAKAMFLEIKRDKYWQKLERYDVSFQNNNLKFDSPTQIFHIVASDALLLQEILLYRILQDIKTVLCVRPESTVEELEEILKAFELPKYTYVTIIWPKGVEEFPIEEVTSKLHQILSRKDYKKVILVTGNSSELARQFQLRNLRYEVIHRSVIFDDLSEPTKRNLLNKRIINCQGNLFNLKELFALEITNVYGAALNSEILVKLICNEEVMVGHEVPPLDLHIERLYISRTFIRDGEEIEEANIFELSEKVILIADGPGMGKSTVLTNLAVGVKNKYPHLWIFNIVLSDYTKILNIFLSQNRTSLNASELLDSRVETRLMHHFEKFLFSRNGRVVLMLDGVDEISPNYTELVENLIVHCQQTQNLAKIIVTSRPHVIEQLEIKLKVKSFKLQPFTKQNQIYFLTTYWSRNLELDETNKAKCERYAEALLSHMRFSKNMGDNDFASIPLQVRMLAEIFQEHTQLEDSLNWQGCKEYLEAKEEEPNLHNQVDFAKLFKMFVDKKRSVYFHKSNPSENVMADLSISRQFDECLEYHRAQAFEVIVVKPEYEFFADYKKNNSSMESEVFNIGIIQKTGNEVQFIHRTFAEYFVAEYLIRELQSQNQNVKFQEFLIDEVLRTQYYPVVCAFFDSFLKEVLDSLPSTIFKEYQSFKYKTNKHSLYLMHDLAKNGYVTILQLILKSIDYEVIKTTNITKFTPFGERGKYDTFGKITKMYRTHRHRNALSLLRFSIQQNGVNIRDRNGETPLDRAIDGGHLGMVKFLVEQGSDINCNRSPSEASGVPLYRAVKKGYFDIVTFLIEQGAKIKPNNEWDYRILYEAVSRDYANIAEYLLGKVLATNDSTKKDIFVLYTAAYLGRLDIIEPLLGEGMDILELSEGATVNDRIWNGQTLLFGAVLGGQLDTIQYLVEHGADINSKDENGNTALHVISKSSSLHSTIKLLIQLGIDLNIANFREGTALNIAAAEGRLDTVQLLIDCGANVNTEDISGRNALYYAVDRGHLNIVKLLIQNGANFHKKGRSVYRALREATENHKSEVVDFLLDFGVDINTKNSEIYPLLHSAVRSDQLDTIKLLIESGIDLNVTDEDGDTALHIAVHGDYLFTCLKMDIIKHLVDSGIDVNARNKKGCTALHIVLKANESHCIRIVKELDVETFEKGLEGMSEADMVGRWNASYSMKDRDKWRLAAFARHLSTVIFLIKRGTDVNLKDSRGNTAASLIKRKDYYGGRLLLKYLGIYSYREKQNKTIA